MAYSSVADGDAAKSEQNEKFNSFLNLYIPAVKRGHGKNEWDEAVAKRLPPDIRSSLLAKLSAEGSRTLLQALLAKENLKLSLPGKSADRFESSLALYLGFLKAETANLDTKQWLEAAQLLEMGYRYFPSRAAADALSNALKTCGDSLGLFRFLLYRRLDEKTTAPFNDSALFLRWLFTPGKSSWAKEKDLALNRIAADILRQSPEAANLPIFGFDRMEDLDGIPTEFSFIDSGSFLFGKKAVVAFFKTTCSFCETELKELNRLWRAKSQSSPATQSKGSYDTATAKPGFVILGIGLPSGLPALFDELKPLQEKLKLSFPIFKASGNEIMEAYRIHSVPLLVLFDQNGKPEATLSFRIQDNLHAKLSLLLDLFIEGNLQELLKTENNIEFAQRETLLLEIASFTDSTTILNGYNNQVAAHDFNSAQRTIDVEFFSDPSCSSCDEFINADVAALEKSTNVVFSMNIRDIMNSDAMERLSVLLEERNDVLKATPVAIVGDIVLQGLPEIREGLTRLARGETIATHSQSNAAGLPALSTIPVFLAGLADGINPCAFSTLLFLLSFLSLAGKNKRELMVIGTVYTLTVFASYFALGLGLLVSLRALSGFGTVARVMRILLALILAILAIANIRDGVLDLKGRRKDMALVLPAALRQRIHGMIRRQRTMGFLIGGTALTALAVSIFELACTGQVYLPVIAWMVKKGDSGRGIGLLALYNAGFILPLAALFLLAWSGKAIKPVADWFETRVWLSKFILASLFILFLILQIAS